MDFGTVDFVQPCSLQWAKRTKSMTTMSATLQNVLGEKMAERITRIAGLANGDNQINSEA